MATRTSSPVTECFCFFILENPYDCDETGSSAEDLGLAFHPPSSASLSFFTLGTYVDEADDFIRIALGARTLDSTRITQDDEKYPNAPHSSFT
jgi:hypothetical protein